MDQTCFFDTPRSIRMHMTDLKTVCNDVFFRKQVLLPRSEDACFEHDRYSEIHFLVELKCKVEFFLLPFPLVTY